MGLLLPLTGKWSNSRSQPENLLPETTSDTHFLDWVLSEADAKTRIHERVIYLEDEENTGRGQG